MKKLIIISIIILSVIACKKTKFAPEGPTDVRVKNISNVPFTEVRVTITDSTKSFGDIAAGGLTGYVRFHKAFPKAEVSARINGQLYSTAAVNFNSGLTYIGQDKITYEVWILNDNLKTLDLRIVYPLDGPLD